MAVFWLVAPCSLVEVYQRFRGPSCCLHHQGDRKDLWNVGKLLLDYTVLQPRRQPSRCGFSYESHVVGTKGWPLLLWLSAVCRALSESVRWDDYGETGRDRQVESVSPAKITISNKTRGPLAKLHQISCSLSDQHRITISQKSSSISQWRPVCVKSRNIVFHYSTWKIVQFFIGPCGKLNWYVSYFWSCHFYWPTDSFRMTVMNNLKYLFLFIIWINIQD
jgi:hypothetical protein